MGAFGYRKPQDFPRTIAVFPLSGALLLPRSSLPLNIFEPRYLNMIDDALGGERLIGMVQEAPTFTTNDKPAIHEIGCVGRITSFAETDDGRYLITLTGLSRFRIAREMEALTPYRQVEAHFEPYVDDLRDDSTSLDIDRKRLRVSLHRYVEAKGFQADWTAVEEAPAEALINALATLCPFEPEEKQALLEAPTLTDRCATLIALLEIDSAAGGEPSPSVQ